MTNGLLKKLGNATKSMFVAGALASLLPNNAKAVPTEWSSYRDIAWDITSEFSQSYTPTILIPFENRLSGICYMKIGGNDVAIGGFDAKKNGQEVEVESRFGDMGKPYVANTGESPDIFWQFFYDVDGNGNFGLQENGVFYDRNEQLFDNYSISNFTPYGSENPGSFTFGLVPEPSIVGLLATGIGAIALKRRRPKESKK